MAITVGGIVLCGGRSRRMGRPKEWLTIRAEPLLCRLVRIVGEAVQPLVVAARADQELPILPSGVEVVRDRWEDAGPLAGLQAGLEALRKQTEAAFVTPCDHPWITPEFIHLLISKLGALPGIVIEHEGFQFPLLGVYRVDVLATLQERVLRGERTAFAFARACGAGVLPADELRAIDPGLRSLRNLNSPADWTEADS